MNTARFARCLPALCLALALSAPAARAATLTVTSAADDGTAGTLRATLAAASAGDTITFALPPRTVIKLTKGQLTIDKALHVVGPIGGGTVIDAHQVSGIFSITGGTASDPVTLSNLHLRHGYLLRSGGGISNNGAVSLTNCTFTGNTSLYGGGLYNEIGMVSLTNCTFFENNSYTDGGGIFNASGRLLLVNCLFVSNDGRDGGGLINFGAMIVRQCTFHSNHAGLGGGLYTSGPTNVTNSVFSRNHAYFSGGGIAHDGGTFTLTNCTFTGNSAQLQDAGGFFNEHGAISLTNSIFYGDSAREYAEISSGPKVATVKHCDVQGGYAGTGNIDADPQFVSASVPFDLRLQASSLCIDAGTPNGAPPYDRAGNPRNAAPDIGAFEFQP